LSKKILVVLSEYGYWGEELVGPLGVFDERGYDITFATPTGKIPHALPPSLDPDFVDPPLGRSVTTEEMAARAQALESSDRLEAPLDISALVPERPYFSASDHLRQLEHHYTALHGVDVVVARFDALLLVGGSGPLVDMANNGQLHELILAFLRADKIVAAECYGVACLAFARDWEDRRSIIDGKHITGHCKEYDYKDGTGFLNTDFNMGPPPYPLEYILRDATGADGRYHGNVGHETSVIVDHPFVTGRSTPDSTLTGEKLVEMLETGLRRWGW
jgi:putative intracellular protease/amidase